MTPFVEHLNLPPDALMLARRLDPQQGGALLWTADGSGPSYLACFPSAVVHGLDPEPELGIGAEAAATWDFPRWIGIIPYEALRSLERPAYRREPDPRITPHHCDASWFRYGAVARIDERVTVLGDDQASVQRLAQQLRSPPRERAAARLRVSEREDAALHHERIAQAQRLILDGDVYLVNLARRFVFEISGSAIDLLQQLGQVTVPPFGAYLQLGDTAVVSTSPELFLQLMPDRRVLTAPIKGTRPRAPESAQDAQLAAQLDADPKERSELAMVVDVERNDLGRVAEIGSVRVVSPGAVVSCGTVWHRVAEVQARLAQPHGREVLLRAMAPSGSVTGAPKVRAMEVIAQLEAHRRGLYTGALGCVSHRGGLTLAMAIRTLTLREGVAHYHAGGGIVLESDPAFELQETEWKAAQLLRLCAGSD